MKKRQKKLLISLGTVLLVFAVFLLCLSPIAKWLIQKYDVPITGREVTVGWVYINPFSGYVHVGNLVVYEYQSDSIFFRAKGLSANLAMLKLFTKTYDITSLTINKPTGYAIQKDLVFNFLDLIEKFKADETKKPRDEQVKFNLRNITIKNGEFHYAEDQTPVAYFIKNVNIKSPGFRYNVDTMLVDFDFASGIGSGEILGNININLRNQNFKLAVLVDTFDLEIINQYTKDLTTNASLSAYLDADIKTKGNFRSKDSIAVMGNLAISDFHFKETNKADLVSFKKLVVAINLLSPSNLIYHFDSIILTQPYAKYELYDYLDNVQVLVGARGKNVKAVNADPNKFNLVIEIAKLVEEVSRNFLRSQYKVGRFAVYEGDFRFADYSGGEQFDIGFSPFTIVADSVDKAQNRVNLTVKSGILPYGEFYVALSVDPKDSSYFDLNYRFQKIPLPLFNPYFTAFTSFPLDRGTLELIGDWRVRASQIQSKNHLIILDPRVANRKRSNDNNWLPLPLAMAFVRERGNVIDYEIPITGSLDNPDFNLWDAILDVLGNMFMKPVTTAYRMEVKTLERELEETLTLKWEHKKSTLSKSQETFVRKVAAFLKENPEAKININPNMYEAKEKEYILLFEAKKQYFLAHHQSNNQTFTEADSLLVERMSIKDEGFAKYLDAKTKDFTLHTTQHKAAKIIAASVVNSTYNNLVKARKRVFLETFKKEKTAAQINFGPSKNVIPFYGFSFYEISFQGKLPEYLKEAFLKMEELNKEVPREMYRKKREKNSAAK